MEYGGFPAVVLKKDKIEKTRLIKDIITSYINNDLRNIKKFKNTDKIVLLMKVFCENVGNLMDVSELSLKMGVSRMTFYSYIRLLESTFLLDFLKPYSSNKTREVTGTKKIFINDNGILNFLAKINMRESIMNAVYNNLKNYGIVRYYKKRTGREIDFIIMGKMIAFNVIIHSSSKDLGDLEKIARYLRLKKYYVISYDFNGSEGFIPVLEI